MKPLNELYGKIGYPGHQRQPRGTGNQYDHQNTFDNQSIQTDPSGIIHKFCGNLRPDQKQIVEALKSRNDVFINMGAGGGKTIPIVCYWLNHYLNLNVFLKRNLSPQQNQKYTEVLNKIMYNAKDLPKLMMVVPTKALAIELHRDFQYTIKNILLQHIVNSTNIDELITISDRNQLNIRINLLVHFFKDTRINQILGAFKRLINEWRNPNLPVDNSNNINPQIDPFAYDWNQKRLRIIDELRKQIDRFCNDRSEQLAVKKDGEGTSPGFQNGIFAVTIYQSSPNTIKLLKNVRLIIFDEAHKNMPTTEQYRDKASEDISHSLYKLLNKIIRKPIQIVFLTGTANPESVKQFTNFLNKYFARNFKTVTLSSANETKINIIRDDRLLFESNYPKILIPYITKKEGGNLFVMYSGIGIERLSGELLRQTGSSSPDNTDEIFSSLPPIGHKKNTIITREMLNKPVSMREAGMIIHPLLRQCVDHGFGFVHSSNNTQFGPVTNEDKDIVLRLFAAKKIYVIIATDAVGVGLNIAAKNMFIPNNTKFNDQAKENVPVPLVELTQLINRLGRGVYKIAYVFSPEKYIEEIQSAVYSTADSFPEVDPHINMGQKLLMPLKRLYMKITCIT